MGRRSALNGSLRPRRPVLKDLMTQELQDRLDLLEAHIAEQERMLHDMSDVMTKQWSSLDKASAKIERLLDRIRALEGQVEAPDNTPPPHY